MAAGAPRGAALAGAGWALRMDDATRPGEAELSTNSRSRSAILHVLRKVRGARMAELEAEAYPMLGWPAADQRNGSGGGEGSGGSAARVDK